MGLWGVVLRQCLHHQPGWEGGREVGEGAGDGGDFLSLGVVILVHRLLASVPLSACGISLPLLFPTYWLICTCTHTDTHTVTFCPGWGVEGGPRTTLDGILSWEEQEKEWDNFLFRLGLLASSWGLCWGHGSPGAGQRDEVSGMQDGED